MILHLHPSIVGDALPLWATGRTPSWLGSRLAYWAG